MSMEAKLRAAATAAAQEAALNERARCLWCLDEIIRELKIGASKKLMSTIELEAAKMKVRIAEGVATAARRAIVSGVRPSPASPPAGGVTGQPGTAGFIPPEGQ